MVVRIKDRSSRVKVCSLKDFVDKGAAYSFARKPIYEGWAAIKPVKPSRFNIDGYAVNEDGEKVSHIIRMNYRYDVEITDAAWIYCERLKSAPIWYRIVSVIENGSIWEFSCRVFEKSDQAVLPDITDTGENIFSPIINAGSVKL